MQLIIYGLYDSAFPDVLRYVGRTFAKKRRLNSHFTVVWNDKCQPIDLWKRALRLVGRKVIYRELSIHEVSDKTNTVYRLDDETAAIEVDAIRRASEAGAALFNWQPVYDARVALGITKEQFGVYRRDVSRALLGNPKALARVRRRELEHPNVYTILHPCGLYEEIQKIQPELRIRFATR